jgi:hypothetical protein
MRADELSAQWTRLPGHLASALLKIYQASIDSKTTNYLFTGFSSSQKEILIQRIESLLQLDIDKLQFNWPKW